MRIAVLGYFNQNNFGDDRIAWTWSQLLAGHEVVFLNHNIEFAPSFFKHFDMLVLGGGGLVFDHYGIFKNLRGILRLKHLSVGAAGLGVNKVASSMRPDLNAFIRKSVFFHVRDERSMEQLRHTTGAKLGCDITWLRPADQLLAPEEGTFAFNLAPCWWKPFDPDAWVKAAGEIGTPLPWPFDFKQGRDTKLLAREDLAEFSWDPVRRSEWVVASRFHAVVFSLQLGVPPIGINYDHKVESILKAAGLDPFIVETGQPEQLREAVAQLRSGRDSVKASMAGYRARMMETAATLEAELMSGLQSVEGKATRRPGGITRFLTRVRHRLGR
jgi:polysaccharide pyruvyl transferase WcaK-like protein